MLFKKVGAPQETIWRMTAPVGRGRVKRSVALPRKNGMKAMSEPTSMAVEYAPAAPSTPQSRGPSKVNSSAVPMTTNTTFTPRLPLM
ncbi:hypothetical protein [Collinsella tanakaei]|uniref:hypothetical protein n=1 Tax=Collinsella tanakaei TaxID=626935 RepID=UPI0019597B26|nr:hypothetical protein [Collinsella tanakaei]MBM6866962.1 hypothetical protein [Collinsella tanakaei]